MKKEGRLLKGLMTIKLGKLYIKNPPSADYSLLFYKENRLIARIYFHPSAKTYAIRTMEADLIDTTLLNIIPFMCTTEFRFTRRRLQRGVELRESK